MMKFFVGDVSITIFICSCDFSDDYTNEQQTTNYYKERSENNMKSYELYKYINDGLLYDKTQNYEDNILLFEQYVNSKLITDEYEKIELNQLSILSKADLSYIFKLNYSQEFI